MIKGSTMREIIAQAGLDWGTDAILSAVMGPHEATFQVVTRYSNGEIVPIYRDGVADEVATHPVVVPIDWGQ